MSLTTGLGLTYSPRQLADLQTGSQARLQSLRDSQVAAETTRRARIAEEEALGAAKARALEAPMVGGGTAPGAVPLAQAPAAATPTARAPAAAPLIQRSPVQTSTLPSQAQPNQSDAESKRLASHLTPAEANAQGVRPNGRDPALVRATEAAQKRRYEELRSKNPATAAPNQSNAETSRLSRGAPPAAAGGPGSMSFETFAQAIFGQESRNGADPRAATPNYAGALGKGQILESTFNGLKQAGKIPANYEWRNPAHNEAASLAYMKEAWDASGGDPARAAAYYYGGPKAIANGGIVTYGDRRNPNAPTTNQYATSVLDRMRGTATAQGYNPAPTPQVAAQQPMPGGATPTGAAGPSMPTGRVGGLPTESAQQLRYLGMQLEEAKFALQNAKTSDQAMRARAAYTQIAGRMRETQLIDVARQSLQNDNALATLAQEAGVPFAVTPQGLVAVVAGPDGQWRAASQPMDRTSFIQALYGRVSGQAAANAARQADVQGKIAVENAKSQGALIKSQMDAEAAVQKMIVERQLNAGDVMGVEFNPVSGKAMVRTRTGVAEITGGDTVDGMRTPTRLVPIQ